MKTREAYALRVGWCTISYVWGVPSVSRRARRSGLSFKGDFRYPCTVAVQHPAARSTGNYVDFRQDSSGGADVCAVVRTNVFASLNGIEWTTIPEVWLITDDNEYALDPACARALAHALLAEADRHDPQ